MFELHTQRLRIIPLGLEPFELLVEDQGKLEAALGLSVTGEKLEGHVLEAMAGLLQSAKAAPADDLPWLTYWMIVLTTENRAIGGACFKGAPGDGGTVEIGYGIDEPFWNRGLMTEALEAICGWAVKQAGVAEIKAETDPANAASGRVLEKIGMRRISATEASAWWRLTWSPS